MLGFCELCHDLIEYSVLEKKTTKNIKNKNIEYIGKEAYCTKCGTQMVVEEINDYNSMIVDNVFRSQEGLISIKDIQSILYKYSIGKRPLSLLLGWGEGTVTRYLNRDIPTKKYSGILKDILEDPKYIREILEKNRGKISQHAYKRCKHALEKIELEAKKIEITIKSEERIDNIVKYFLTNCVDITPLALQKLLYYAQGFYKIFNGEYLFNNNCEAWVHGPVYRNIYDKYKSHVYNPIENNIIEFENIELSESEKEILDSIIINFGCYSGKILEKMTHIELPWRTARIGLNDNEISNRIIEKELITEYFQGVKSKYNMFNIFDIRDYSIDLFKKIHN